MTDRVDDPAPTDALFTGGLTYVADGSRRLKLDVLRPASAAASRPMVLFVHGGGWHEGDPAAPPFLLAHGSRDEIVPIGQSLALRDALASAGGKVQWAPVDGAPHEWADRPGDTSGTETAGTFGALALSFFREHL